jgi:sugar lactone lactonase YvrE
MTPTCVLDAKAECGESPVWLAEEQALYWSDIPRRTFNRFDPASGQNVAWPMEEEVCSFAPCAGGGFVAALRTCIAFIDPAKGLVRRHEASRIVDPELRYNDGRCDRSGRFFWVGTMHLPRTRKLGRLFRFSADGRLDAMAGGVLVANGLAFSPDGSIMYWSDSRSRMVWRFDHDPATGAIARQTVFATPSETQGRPDGAAVDCEGFYWSACFAGGRVLRYAPDGRIDREILLPVTNATMCAFGGPDLATLYVTSGREGLSDAQLAAEPLAGGLFAVEVGVRGLPEPRFQPASGLLGE